MSSSQWTCDGKVFDPDEDFLKQWTGFVYELENLSDGRKYIGKKLFWSTRKLPPLKGKTRKRTVRKQSDWRDYHGSNEEVKLLLERGESFSRRVLKLCKTKGQCSYWEAKFQFERDVLLRDDYYNAFIGCKIHESHLLDKSRPK